MQNIFLSLIFFGMSSLYASDSLTGYSKIELRDLGVESGVNIDFGIFHANTPYKVFGVFGIKSNDNDSTLLSKLVLSSRSIGFMSNIAGSNDEVISVEGIEGRTLSSLCSRYHGGNLGLAVLAGADGFAVRNRNGVSLKSGMTVYGVKVNIAYKTVKVTCLEEDQNSNWNKIVQFD